MLAHRRQRCGGRYWIKCANGMRVRCVSRLRLSRDMVGRSENIDKTFFSFGAFKDWCILVMALTWYDI